MACPTCMATLRGQASRAPADSSRGARTHPPGSEDAPEAGSTSSARQCPLCPCVQGRGIRWERGDPEGSALSLCRAMGTDLLGAKGSCSSIPPWAQVLVEGGKAALPAFLSQTHLPSGNVPLHCQQGTAEALAGDQPARTRLHLESSPAAERATGELPGGTSSLSAAELGPSAPPGSLPRQVSSQCRQRGRAAVPAGSPTLSASRLAPRDPPAEGHPARQRSRHSGTARGGGKAAVLTFAWPSIRVSRLLALNVLHWAREKEGKKVRSDASAARLEDQGSGDRAETRATLTARRRLSSFSRTLMEGSRVTRALFAPSACLCTGKGQRRSEPQATASLSSESHPKPSPATAPEPSREQSCLQSSCLPGTRPCFPACLSLLQPEEEEAFRPCSSPVCPRAARSRGGISPQLGSWVAPAGCAWSIQGSTLTPAGCPPTAPSGPGSCRKRGETASGPAAPPPVGRGGRLQSPAPWGRTRGQEEAPGGRTEALPKPWLPLSCQSSSCFCPCLLGTKRGAGDAGRANAPPIPPCQHAACSLPGLCTEGRGRSQHGRLGTLGNLSCPAVARGPTTHPNVATQEPVGQTRMMEALSSSVPSSSCSSSSRAASFPLLSTHSRSRARRSCGRRLLPRLQRREAGRELEVASLGSPRAEPCPPPAVGREVGASSSKVAGLVPGAGVSLCWCQGQGWGQGSWAGRVLPQLGDDQFLREEEKAPLAPLAAPGQPHVRAQHRLGAGESLPAEQRAAGMRKGSGAGPGRARVSPSRGGSPPGAAAAAGLAHPARDRRTLGAQQGCGAAGDSEDEEKRGAGGGGGAVLSGRACLLAALLRASTAPSCCLWWLLAPADQGSEPNGQWGGQCGGGSLQSGHVCLALGSPEQDTAEGKDHLPPPAASAPCLGLQLWFLASDETRCHWAPPSRPTRSATLPSSALLLSPGGACFLPAFRHISLLQWPHKPICQLPQHLRI